VLAAGASRGCLTHRQDSGLNVYRMGAFYFLDLPGYGYAKAGQAQRREFRALITRTLDRGHLAGSCGARRPARPEPR